MARVVRTQDVRDDLKQIGRYIAQQSQSRAVALRFLDKIKSACELYATQPEMGTHRPDLVDNIRLFSVDDYVVIYRPLKDGILVLLVTQGSRDVATLFQRRFGGTDQ